MEDEEQQQQEEEEQQQEGEEDDGMGSFYSSAADEEEEEEEDPPRRLGCQWVMRGEKWWEAHPSIRGMVFGQMISGAIAGCGMAAAALSDRGVNLPNTLNFLTYLGLCLYLLWLRRPLALSPWWYLGYAAVDVQANVLALLSFKYTTITSVMLLDCASIPVAMLLSVTFLAAVYSRMHLLGVGVCIIGLVVIVLADMGSSADDANYPRALQGDIICLSGAFLYGAANVMQEGIVKSHDRLEFLGMCGLFGAIISGAQVIIFELQLLLSTVYTPVILGLAFMYIACLWLMYSATSSFLKAGDATMFNLSLLTSDFYGFLFAVLIEHHKLSILYGVGFSVIICSQSSATAGPRSHEGFVSLQGAASEGIINESNADDKA